MLTFSSKLAILYPFDLIYIIIVVLGIYYWCKFRNANKNYEKVVEVEIPSVQKTETNIEIVHDTKETNAQESSKENP